MKILIVDDDQLILNAISHQLKIDGFQVLLARDGFQALDLIEHEKIDLVISDMMMPNISGLGLLSLLRQFYFNSIPVIIISSLDQADVIMNSVGLGAAGYIIKPINFSTLSTLVKKHVRKVA